jgi:tetratricopeptide (TPR) repeat protein
VELKELVVGAQDAMDGGDFRLALAANTHALKAYPACLAAHRMMGEAYLERGDQEPAVKHFERTLQIDPLNVVARLGLGVAAEELKNFQAAYAHYLHAWEINPALDQVRDELVRLRGLLNVDDRLHPTRAGLAGIHARAGQFRRAIGEWRAVLAVEPESRRGRTALAELLWRGGDDTGAGQAAREALRGCPDNARALAILADVERRRGAATAEETAERYAQVDPTGEIIAILQPWRMDTDLSFLTVDSAPLDDFDFDAHRSRDTGPLGSRKTVTASLAGGHVAAPDLWDTLVKDFSTDIPSTNVAPTMASGVEPFNWNDTGASQQLDPVAESSSIVDVSEQLFGAAGEQAEPEPAAVHDAMRLEAPAEDDRVQGVEGEAFVASVPPAAGAISSEMNPDTFDDLIRTMAAAEPAEEELVAVGVPIGVTASGEEETNQADSSEGYGSFVSSHGGAEIQAHAGEARETHPASAYGAASVTSSPASPGNGGGDFVDPFVTADGQIDLTRGWDELDRALADATPTFDADESFDGLLADLEGIEPFDAVIEGGDEEAWAPLSADDLATEPVAAAPSVDATGTVDPVSSATADASDWIDEPSVEVGPLELPSEDEIQAPAAIETYPSVLEQVVAEEEPRDATGELLELSDLEAFDASPYLEEVQASPIEPEIITGIPTAQPSGYTELLRNVDEETLAVSGGPEVEVDPFAIPDGTGEPLEFQELLEVTSSDGTGPLASGSPLEVVAVEAPEVSPLDFAATDLDAALPAAEPDDLDLELDGILPFDSSAFADATAGDEPMEFGEIDNEINAVELDEIAELEVEPFAPEIRPFGYTDALSALDEEPFDFSDVVVEPEAAMAESSDDTSTEEAPVAAEAEAAEADQTVEPPEVAAELEPVANAEAIEVEAEPLEVAPPAWAGKEGLGAIAHKVLWPKFVNQTSELIDRAMETDDLFERIAQQKHALIAQGAVATGLRIAAVAPAPVAAVSDAERAPEADAVADHPEAIRPAAPEMSEQTRLDLMAMRIRLVEDEEAAPEIADALEQAIAEGLHAPLALRVLGEAYLKMGLVERAAAQFRQAMLARRRVAQESRYR